MSRERLEQILNLARWAPSGDNTQPWRFEVLDELRVRVHGHDTRDHVLYDYHGHPSHIAHGALLETLRIAATNFGMSSSWTLQSDPEMRTVIYDVVFVEAGSIAKDPLFDCIQRRAVQRRPMRMTQLTGNQLEAIRDAAGPDLQLRFFQRFAERLKISLLLWRSAEIRLLCKEAYPVHRDIIEWRVQFSKDRIPEQAVGVDAVTARLMQWVMKSWDRVTFFNRFLGGTYLPRLQLDLLPGLFCGAHVAISAPSMPSTLEQWVNLGVRWQRIWLTITQVGLHMQPEMTPIIFRWYARNREEFTQTPSLNDKAIRVSEGLEEVLGASASTPIMFLFRVGKSNTPQSRSIRQDLDRLTVKPE